MKYILVYLPVIHSGYTKFFKQDPDAAIRVIDQSLVDVIDAEFDYLRKEIRSLTPQEAITSIRALLPERKISLLSINQLAKIDLKKNTLILPNEDIFRWLVKQQIHNAQIKFDQTFLRWDRHNTVKKLKVHPNNKLSQLVIATQEQSQFSSDWWRQVAASIFEESKNNQVSKLIVTTYNKHLPHEYIQYFDSDPRNSFHTGEHIELSTAIHAEAAVIAWCAKNGISCDGLGMYVTTFPCPVCAKLIAQSGIKKLYFTQGYSMLDGEKVLKSADIEITQIN